MDSMKGDMVQKSEFTLDFVCVNDSALKCVESAYILERGEVVESDWSSGGKYQNEREIQAKKKADQGIGSILGVKWKEEIMKIYLV